MTIRQAYLDAAESARALLQQPAVDERWTQPSALLEFSVGGLAGHLAHQVLAVPSVLAAPVPNEQAVPLLSHYERATWMGSDLSSEANVGIRQHAQGVAADGADTVISRLSAAIDELRETLPNETHDRVVRTTSGPWSLLLDDFLITRMMEIAVHSDDLAVSVDLPTPELPEAVLAPVLSLLTGLAVRRHGQPAVLRALSRAERAPAAINAL
jgi:hypothetical protein